MSVPLSQRWFEDYTIDEVFEFGDYLITEEEIVEFARRYDPQPFHLDRDAAVASHFGGIVASGWMTASALMRMMCDHFISRVSALGSPGIDELRWLKPVRPGDRLHARVTIVEAKRSQSRPDRGAVTLRQEALNQTGEVVMSMLGRALHRCRESTRGALS